MSCQMMFKLIFKLLIIPLVEQNHMCRAYSRSHVQYKQIIAQFVACYLVLELNT